MLFLRRSFWLVDYLVWVTVFNRGIRRYVDWMQGSFNPLSPISLTPLIVSALLFLIVVQRFSEFPPHVRRIMQLFGAALGIAFLVGLASNGLAAVYTLAEYVTPISVIGIAVLTAGDERILDRWLHTVGWAAMTASAYGWYQYYTIPAWDAFWVRAVGMEGYLGYLRPTEMTVFSTMSERGPFGSFLAAAVTPMILAKRWRNFTGWAGVILLLSTMLLTYVRTAIITIVLTAILYPILNRGKGSLKMVVAVCVAGIGINLVLSLLPSSEKIDNRVGSIQTITDDGSFQGRILIAIDGVQSVLTNPIGSGLGSTGLAGRVNTGTSESTAVIGDNGYLEILLTFGWLGSAAFFYALVLMWTNARHAEKLGFQTESIAVFKALFVTGAVVLMVGNWFASSGSLVFAMFAGFALVPRNPMKDLILQLLLLEVIQEEASNEERAASELPS